MKRFVYDGYNQTLYDRDYIGTLTSNCEGGGKKRLVTHRGGRKWIYEKNAETRTTET